jgi:hypothetical protein
VHDARQSRVRPTWKPPDRLLQKGLDSPNPKVETDPGAFADRDDKKKKATPGYGARVTFAYVFSGSAERLSVSQFLFENLVCLEPLAAAFEMPPFPPPRERGRRHPHPGIGANGRTPGGCRAETLASPRKPG